MGEVTSVRVALEVLWGSQPESNLEDGSSFCGLQDILDGWWGQLGQGQKIPGGWREV